MEIHVIRHTPVNVAKDICYGRLNVPLADTFQHDVQLYKEKLDGLFDAIYSSPSERCVSLAQALAYDNVLLDESLFELNFGDWEGKTWNDINKDELNDWMSDFVNKVAGNGESLAQMFNRVSQFVERLRHENHEKVLIICHAGVIRCLWAHLLTIPLNNVFKIPVGFHELLVFSLGETPELDTIVKLS